jgi:hypothetical protein
VEALEHTALIYRSKPEFVASVLPHVLLGLQRGEPVLVVTCPDNLDALVSSVGAESSRVEFRDSTQWYDDPGSAFRRYRAYIDDHSASSRVRIIGEPPWLRRAAPEVEVWLRYESVINIALETRLGLILCPYNATELSAHLLAGARATHPHVYEKGQLIESEEFTPFFPTPT